VDIIIISILCLLATAKVTLQGGFAKKNIRSFSDGVFFNGAIFFFSSFVFLKDALTFNLPTFLFGAAFGILSLIFQLCYIKAMSFGNVSITVLIVNRSGATKTKPSVEPLSCQALREFCFSKTSLN